MNKRLQEKPPHWPHLDSHPRPYASGNQNGSFDEIGQMIENVEAGSAVKDWLSTYNSIEIVRILENKKDSGSTAIIIILRQYDYAIINLGDSLSYIIEEKKKYILIKKFFILRLEKRRFIKYEKNNYIIKLITQNIHINRM